MLKRIIFTLAAASVVFFSLSLYQPVQADISTHPGYNGNIFYNSSKSGEWKAYLMNAEGSDIHSFDFDIWEADWNPKGIFLAYTTKINTVSYIYTINADGSGQKELYHQDGQIRSIQWSPNGAKLIFMASVNDCCSSGPWEYFVIDADGSGKTTLSTAPISAYGTYVSPRWLSNDTIVYVADTGSNFWDIFSVKIDGSNRTQLTTTPDKDEYEIVTSPSINKIAFVSDRDAPNHDVFLMNGDGSNVERITNTPDPEEDLSISPDGTKIAYHFWLGDNEKIFYTDIKTKIETEIALDTNNFPDALNADGSTWSPDSTHLLVDLYNNSWNMDNWYSIKIADLSATKLTQNGLNQYSDIAIWQPIPNQAPQAINDSFSVTSGVTAELAVLANDSDAEEVLSGQYLTIKSQPLHGVATVNIQNGKLSYTSAAGYSGADSLTYQICDSFIGNQQCATATVGITITMGNTPQAKPEITLTSVNGQSFGGGIIESNTLRPIFNGTASMGAEIRVEIHSDPIILTAVADANGRWSAMPSKDIPAGEHTVKITASLNGQTAVLGAYTLMVSGKEIPATGTNWIWPRIGGVIFVVLGIFMAFWRRHNLNKSRYRVPTLV